MEVAGTVIVAAGLAVGLSDTRLGQAREIMTSESIIDALARAFRLDREHHGHLRATPGSPACSTRSYRHRRARTPPGLPRLERRLRRPGPPADVDRLGRAQPDPCRRAACGRAGGGDTSSAGRRGAGASEEGSRARRGTPTSGDWAVTGSARRATPDPSVRGEASAGCGAGSRSRGAGS